MKSKNRTNQSYGMIASIFALALVGCGNVDRAKIVGVWNIEHADTVLSRLHGSGPTEDDQELEFSTPKMSLEFRQNGHLATSTNMGKVIQEKKGTWKLVSFDSATQRMIVLCNILDQQSEHEVEFVDQETIKLVPPNMAGTTMKIKFRRQH